MSATGMASDDVADHGSHSMRLPAPLTYAEMVLRDAQTPPPGVIRRRFVTSAYPTATTTRGDAAFDQALADLAYVLGLDATHAAALRARVLAVAAANTRPTPTTTQEP